MLQKANSRSVLHVGTMALGFGEVVVATPQIMQSESVSSAQPEQLRKAVLSGNQGDAFQLKSIVT